MVIFFRGNIFGTLIYIQTVYVVVVELIASCFSNFISSTSKERSIEPYVPMNKLKMHCFVINGYVNVYVYIINLPGIFGGAPREPYARYAGTTK